MVKHIVVYTLKEGVNKPEAVEAMRKAASGREGVEIAVMRTKYPQGGEKQLIKAVTGREVPSGKLPIEVHTIVMNVGTAAAVADAVTDGRPLIDRITTVTGCVLHPANLRLRIGTIIADVIGECGGFSEEPGKIVFGGGMTGLCAALASARHGARTALVQDRPVLGGNASSEIRMHICGASANMKKPDLCEGGIVHELMLRNKQVNDSYNYSIWDAVLFSAAKAEKNLTLYLNTTMYEAVRVGDRIERILCYQMTT